MKFIVAATALCVATVAITSADAAKPAKEGEKKASTSRILRKLPTKGEAVRVNNSNNKAEDKVLAEDEGYWERFLQNEVPSITDHTTPSPTPPLEGGVHELDMIIARFSATAATATTKKTSSWDKPDDKPNVPKVGYYDIDTSEYGGSMDVKNRGNEECFTTGEGIGKNGWAFGITAGRIPNTNTTDTYLQLFDKDAPLKPLYKAFQGATKLCIGEKKGNIAYLYVVYGDATYWLIGHPDAGRKDHLPKLKIRNSIRRRLSDAEKINDKYNNGLGEYVVVSFRDGPGITNTLWEIFEDGSDQISPDAKWYKTGNDDP